MYYTGAFPQELTSQADNTLRVDNALIEEINIENPVSGSVLISYGSEDQNHMLYKDLLQLNISEDTIIMDQYGETLYLEDLTPGMRVDAEFSAAMTRSIPPQASAYQIVALTEEPSVNITTDRVVDIDVENSFLTTGNPYDIYDQIRFNISEATVILDQEGNRIPLMRVTPGQLVTVEHAIFQTLSIPPQSPAFLIQII
jgi:hypothetical protein